MATEMCSICMDEIEEGSGVVLDCNHAFHAKCAITWFRYHNDACPNCRSDYSRCVPFQKTPAQRIASMKRHHHRMPPWVKSQLRRLERLQSTNRELSEKHRLLRKEHAEVFKTVRNMVKRKNNVQKLVTETIERLSQFAVPYVPFLNSGGVPTDFYDEG